MLDPGIINRQMPIAAISVNPRTRTARVHRLNLMPPTPPTHRGKRTAIRYLSAKALHNLAFLAANTNSRFGSILTLTFLSPPTARSAKRFLDRFLTWLRRVGGSSPLRYLWFMEFQTRGAIHYHILLSTKYTRRLHREIALFWANLVEPLDVAYTPTLLGGRKPPTLTTKFTREAVLAVHLHKRAYEAVRSEDGAKHYALKYALKTRQKAPPGWIRLTGRWWGCDRETGKIDWSEFETSIISEDQLRAYLRVDNHPTADYDVIPKVLFNLG